MIIATAAASGEVIEAAKADPYQHFLLVTAAVTAAAAPGNTVIVSPSAAPARIGQAIHALAAQA
jgi:hypothetical protein